MVKGLGPVFQIAEGYTHELPKKAHDILDKRTDPGWPTTWFMPNLTGSGAFSYGHIGADLITLCSMFRIPIPVCMHNADEDKIFRPSAWTGKAPTNFSPLYR